MRGQKTQTRNQPRPLNPMWETGYSSELEARFAKLHNLIGLEGRLSNDPVAVALREVKSELKSNYGVTFEIGVATEPAAALVKATQAKAAAPAARPAKPAASAPAATSGRKLKARKIREDQIEALQVRGTVSDDAPYGCDDQGHPLAPYGVKKDGTPMLRRGRKASDGAPAPTAKAAKVATAAKRGAEPTTRMPEPNTVDEFDLSMDDEDEGDDEGVEAAEDESETVEASAEDTSETESVSDDVNDEDIDDVLANL